MLQKELIWEQWAGVSTQRHLSRRYVRAPHIGAIPKLLQEVSHLSSRWRALQGPLVAFAREHSGPALMVCVDLSQEPHPLFFSTYRTLSDQQFLPRPYHAAGLPGHGKRSLGSHMDSP
jgi:hypothetical protein